MNDGELVRRLRLWRAKIIERKVFDAIDWLAQTEQLFGAWHLRYLKHPRLFGRALNLLWGETKAIVALRSA